MRRLHGWKLGGGESVVSALDLRTRTSTSTRFVFALVLKKSHPGKLHCTLFTKKVRTVINTEGG